MFAEKVIQYLKGLEFSGELPAGISIMNPYRERNSECGMNEELRIAECGLRNKIQNPKSEESEESEIRNPQSEIILQAVSKFYHKFYNDELNRNLILGINPGRFGAGVTGIPFTDSKRLAEKCGIIIPGLNTFETSSVFIYEMIEAFGGTEKFYKKYFVSAVCPLGFTSATGNGKSINYNYYDSPALLNTMKDFIIDNLKKQLDLGIERDVCFCLGTGKNFKYLLQLNNELHIFNEIVPLEHPRFIMQYKLKQKKVYIEKYLSAFGK
jgi:hypothetical protein